MVFVSGYFVTIRCPNVLMSGGIEHDAMHGAVVLLGMMCNGQQTLLLDLMFMRCRHEMMDVPGVFSVFLLVGLFRVAF